MEIKAIPLTRSTWWQNMKNSMQASDCLDIQDWYKKEIGKYIAELIDLKKKLAEQLKAYNRHMLSNVGKAYALTKQESLANRTKLTAEYKKDYKELNREYLDIASTQTRKLFVEDTLARLKHERDYDGKLRNKDNQSQYNNS